MEKEKESAHVSWEYVYSLCWHAFVFGVLAGVILLACINQHTSSFLDYYSLELTGIDGRGQPAGISALAFNVTLHVQNKRLMWTDNRFSHGKVVVSYAGVAIGEGRVPGFGVGASSAAQVKAVALSGKAGVADAVRRRVEAELRWDSAEFDVEAKLFRSGVGQRGGPVVLWCMVASRVLHQPSPCRIFTDFMTEYFY
ncbi:hypothetical protein ZWY2020_055578 [Hordeum vulgare]|nr:hypothetical protein ZWY2020_055578 [Hordeum vulgare]